jgi:acetyl esterase/lipase
MMRKMILAGVAQLPPLSDSLEELEIQIPVSDGWQSRTIIVRPKPHVKAKRPLIVHFYGGGMIVGEPEQLLSAARAFAEVYGAVVALPSYRLTPDVQWQYVSATDLVKSGANLECRVSPFLQLILRLS